MLQFCHLRTVPANRLSELIPKKKKKVRRIISVTRTSSLFVFQKDIRKQNSYKSNETEQDHSLNFRRKVSRDVSSCRGVLPQGQGEEEGVLILITARSFAVQLEPSNWTLSWSHGDDGSVDKTGYRPSQ